MMTWLKRYRLRRFLHDSLWPVPFWCMAASLVAAPLVQALDRATGWTVPISADAARSVAGTLASSLLTLIVFVFSILLVAVQLASAQLTPRMIARVFRDPVTKWALGIFSFVFCFSLMMAARVTDPVPYFMYAVTKYGSWLSLGVFLFLVDRFAKELRPVRILTAVAAEARQVIGDIYPRKAGEPAKRDSSERVALGAAQHTVMHSRPSGVVLAFDVEGLVGFAQAHDCVIELVPQVGDFIATEDPLFRVYGGQLAGLEARLLASIAFGAERTLEQDPAFAFRIIVDIASKALSPAINDPTTAVLAIDQLHHLLRLVGQRELDSGLVRDSAGKLRLVYRTPDWEDFVMLAVTEIRHFGGNSIQVVRRLRAMLENLIATLPAARLPIVREELALVQRTADRAFVEPEDQNRSRQADCQGVGGGR